MEYDQVELMELIYQYEKEIGGDPMGLTVPYGWPDGVEEHGGPINVYKQCLKHGLTWREYLNIQDDDDDDIII